MAETTHYKKPMSVVRYDENGLKYLEMMPLEVTPDKNIIDYSPALDMQPTDNTGQERKLFTTLNALKRKVALPVVATALASPALLVGGIAGANALIGSITSNPLLWADATQKTVASMVGGEAVNKLSRRTTGNSWGKNINVLTRGYVPTWVGEMTNPGYALSSPIQQVANRGLSTISNGVSKIKGLVELVSDPYTSFSANFGYYGNPFNRAYGTVARRLGLPDKGRTPELLRRVPTISVTGEGLVLISRPLNHIRAKLDEFKDLTNFTWDLFVLPHLKGSWQH